MKRLWKNIMGGEMKRFDCDGWVREIAALAFLSGLGIGTVLGIAFASC
jgi:hypothetical protein